MPFEAGNQWWKARSKHGSNGLFNDAADLERACQEYFEWNENNPLLEEKVSFYQGVPTHDKVSKMRAMTESALSRYIGVSHRRWMEWKANKDHDFSHVIEWACGVIRDQKFAGAAADLLNANIISRDLGLADKQDVTSSDGSMTPKEPRTLDDFYAPDPKPEP